MSNDEDPFDSLGKLLDQAELNLSVAMEGIGTLVTKSQALVDLLDDSERNHGGLISVDLLTARDELRLELAKWKS